MRQKFILTVNRETKELTIEEFSELHKEFFTLISTNNYKDIIIEDVPNGKKAVISSLRNKSIFPVYECAELLAETIITIADSDYENSAEIYFDDKDYIQIGDNEYTIVDNSNYITLNNDEDLSDIVDDEITGDEIDETTGDIDELIEDDETIKVSSSIKIAEDEIDKSSLNDEEI